MEQVDISNYKFIKIQAEVRTGIIISIAIRTDIGQIVATEGNADRIRVNLDMNRITEKETSGETRGAMVERRVEESIETIIEMTVMLEVVIVWEKGNFPEAITTIEIGVQAIVGPGQDQEQVWIETEYDVISVGNMIISQRTVPLLGK